MNATTKICAITFKKIATCKHCTQRPGEEAEHYAKDGPADQVARDVARLKAWADAAHNDADACAECGDRASAMLAYDFE